jgi:Ser/Thr protein kinase RdoA (MazF antagonist)
LAATGFPAPRPITAFAGPSWLAADGGPWTLVSFQPGHTLGREDEPSLGEVGRFIARYHDAVEHLEIEAPRPLVPSIDELATLAPWDRLEQTLHGRDGVGRFRKHLDQTMNELAETGHAEAPRLFIHGDFTTDNILIDGEPPTIVGAIDFALTNREVVLADVAFGLWRSGRPESQAMTLDPARAWRRSWRGTPAFGHYRRRLLAPCLPTYLKARGLQLIVRATRAGALDCSIQLERIDHIAAQEEQLRAAVTAVLD